MRLSPWIGSKGEAHQFFDKDQHNYYETFQSMHLIVGDQPYRLITGFPLSIVSQQQLCHIHGICFCSQVKRDDVPHFTSYLLQLTASFAFGTSLHERLHVASATQVSNLYIGQHAFTVLKCLPNFVQETSG